MPSSANSLARNTVRHVPSGEYPLVNFNHLFPDAVPIVFAFDQRVPAPAHLLKLAPRHRKRTLEGVDQRIDPDLDPPTAAVVLQILPWSGASGNYRHATSQGFGNHQAKVFTERRKHKKIAAEEKLKLWVPPDLAAKTDLLFQ